MKIVGIATRARITDYSLPYVAPVQTVWWTLWLFLLFNVPTRYFSSCYIYYVYTYRHSANNEIINFHLFFFFTFF